MNTNRDPLRINAYSEVKITAGHAKAYLAYCRKCDWMREYDHHSDAVAMALSHAELTRH